jgi:hypothetical protein
MAESPRPEVPADSVHLAREAEVSENESTRNGVRSNAFWRKNLSRLGSTILDVGRGYQGLPRRVHILVYSGIAIITAFAGYSIFFAESAKLRIICQHNFRSAELSVWVDGKATYHGSINSTSKKRLGVFQTSQGTLSKVFLVPSGSHTVQVQVSAPSEGFLQSQTTTAELYDKRETVLIVNAGRRTPLSISVLSAAGSAEPTQSSSGSAPKPGPSILFAVLWSTISATIGFLVQEFLRAQKARLTGSRSAN